MGAAKDRRWRIIARFLKPLHTLLAVDERIREGKVQSSLAGLVLALPPVASAGELRRMRAALELLHTLWLLDREAWREALNNDISGLRVQGSLVLMDADHAPCIVVSLHHDKFPWQVRQARWKELLETNACLTTEELHAKNRLLESYNVSFDCGSSIPLRLQFLVFGMASSVVEDYVTAAVSMVASVQAELQQPLHAATELSGQCSPFVLQSVELDLSAITMTSGISHQVIRLHGLGVGIHKLAMRLVEYDGSGDQQDMLREDCDRLMEVLMPPPSPQPPRVCGLPPVEFTIETLVIDRAGLTQFELICSAIERTDTVKYLQLRNVFIFDSPEDRARKWQWLAQAIFSPASRTSVRHLAIDQIEYLQADVDAVTMALQSVHEHRPGTSHRHEHKSLAIGAEASDDETLDTIPLLLAQVGLELRSLSVYLWAGELLTVAVASIMTTCRHLQYLDLSSVQLDSMDVFVQAYEQHGCQISSLALHNVEVANESVVAFASVLSDSGRTPAHVLKDLCLDSVGMDNTMDGPTMEAFLHLLQVNKTLEYLELRVALPDESSLRGDFHKHDNTWLSEAASVALPFASKAAFLSAASSVHRQTEQDAEARSYTRVQTVMRKLDDRMLSMVMQFAATPRRRRVYVADP